MFLDAQTADVFFRSGPGVGSKGQQERLVLPAAVHNVAPFMAEAATSRFSGHVFLREAYM